MKAADTDRLMQAAVVNMGLTDGHWAGLARLLGESDQTVNNWRTRGIPVAKLLDVAEKVRCDPYWLRDGQGEPPMTIRDPHLKELLRCAEPLPAYAIDHAIREVGAIRDLLADRRLEYRQIPAASDRRRPGRTADYQPPAPASAERRKRK